MLKNVEMGLLNDYYGGLLTEYQRDVLVKYFDEDLSLAEIAETSGISRQAVRDVIVRATAKLREFESKLGLVAKITGLMSELEQIIVSTDTETADRLNRTIIEGECETYILDKAAALGLEVREAAVTARWSDEGFWYPWECRLSTGEGDMSGLSRLIEAELGIPEARQRWEAEE